MISALVFAASINVGAIEVVGEPGGEHLGVYPYVAISTVVPTGKVAWIPSLGVEYCPEFSRWGFVASLTGDYAISDRIGLDLNVSVIHDQLDSNWDDSIFLAGGGPGISIFLGKWTVSPYISYFVGIDEPGNAIVPGLNIALSL